MGFHCAKGTLHCLRRRCDRKRAQSAHLEGNRRQFNICQNRVGRTQKQLKALDGNPILCTQNPPVLSTLGVQLSLSAPALSHQQVPTPVAVFQQFLSLSLAPCKLLLVVGSGAAKAPLPTGWSLSCIWLCGLDLRCHFATKEISNGAGNFLMVRFESEVAGIIETYLRARIVTFEGFRTRRQIERITLAPDRE